MSPERLPSSSGPSQPAHSIASPGAPERLRAAVNEYELGIAKARNASVTGISSLYDALSPTLIAFLADNYLASELSRDEEGRWGRPPVAGFVTALHSLAIELAQFDRMRGPAANDQAE